MTKIKNTKKGMAKKTLSISLAVAMLATSNVPVWAAEDLFTDGEVAVEAFTAEEAPVVEETEEAPVAEAEDNYGYTTNIAIEENGNGWAGDIVLKNTVAVTDKDGKPVDYTWTIRKDGREVKSEWTNQPASTMTTAGWFIPLTHDDYNHVYDVYIEITLANGEKVGLTSNKLTVSPVDIDKIAKENNHYLDFAGLDATYTGNEIKLEPSDNYLVVNSGKVQLDRDDFVLTYSGETTNYTGKPVVVTGRVKVPGTNEVDPAYVGGITGEYTITQRDLSVNELVAELKNPDIVHEYTADLKKFAPEEVTVKIKDDSYLKSILADSVEDISYSIKTAVAAGSTGKATGKQDVNVTLDTSKLTNFKWNGGTTVTAVDAFKIAKRNLDKVTATVNRSYSVDELRKGVLDNLEPSDLTFKDADGKTIKLAAESITIELNDAVINKNTSGADVYTKGIKITGNTAYCENGPITASLTIVQNGLANGHFEGEVYAKDTEEFAGEGVAVKKDTKKLGNFVVKAQETDAGYYLTEGVDYVIEYANNDHASTEESGEAQLIVKGIGTFAGSEAVFEFPINQAPIVKAETDKVELVYNPEYTSAADYLKDLQLTVTANNLSTTAITTDRFTLKDSEYVITNLKELKDIENVLKGADENFTFDIDVKAAYDTEDGHWTGNYSDEATTKTVTVCKKSLSSEDVTVTVKPDTYVYTGTQIVPEEIIVRDGATILEEGTDYEVVRNIYSNDAVDAGTAKVTVVAKADGRYKPGSTATGTFTITPADINDVEVTYATATYDGKKHNDASKVTLKLGDIDVTDNFTVSFPYSKNANINAGKEAGKLTITATSAKAKNYTAKAIDAAFEIKPAALTGSIVVYDEAGRIIRDLDTVYDGSAHTFADVKFVPAADAVTGAMKLTADDYEIVYADNVYGKYWKDASAQLGHVFVIAKGNYVGKLTQASHNELAADGKFVDANGKEFTSIAASQHFAIEQVALAASKITVENGVYASGYTVKPNVTVKYDGKVLVEGLDYELDLSGNKNLVDVTTNKTLTVKVNPINGYKKADAEAKYVFNWGIDKFDLANAEILVSGTDADPVIKVMNGTALVDTDDYDLVVADGKATVTAKADSKNYTGTQTVDIKHALEKPVAPMITDVKVVGNKATVILSGESEGATGYDYVISPNRNCIVDKDYTKVNKNKLTTDTTFTYTQQGTYYAYCHAWTRDENGKKVFSDWSNGFPFMVTAITPDQPVITNVSVKGSTVTVTYTKADAATGYDVVLGSAMATVANEKRPVNYGTLVKKNIKANTVTATFTNVPAGTYYAGLHAFNRTSEDGKKVFSPWSNAKKVTVR